MLNAKNRSVAVLMLALAVTDCTRVRRVVNDQRIYQRKVKQMAKFIPNAIQHKLQEVPFFEDSQKEDIPGRGTKKSVEQLQGEVE
jgi:hypothetical protein